MLRIPQKGNILEKIDLDLTPYLKAPMKLIGNTRVKWIMCVAPTQSGKTVFLQTAFADTVIQDPGPMIWLLPDEKMGRKLVQEKLIDVLENTPEMAIHKTGHVRDVNKAEVNLKNMNIALAWGGSLSTMSSIPRKRAAVDEARLLPLTTGNESNAIQLIEDRLTTYLEWGLAQAYLVSSPSVEGDLLFNQLDVPFTSVWMWHSKCQSCGEIQLLDDRKHLKKRKCLCQSCGAEFSNLNRKKDWNIHGLYIRMIKEQDGHWRASECNNPSNWYENNDRTDREIFWWNSMVSPFRSFTRIANKYIEVKDKLHDYKNYVQCWRASFWVDDISKTSSLKLKDQRRGYRKGDVPEGVKVITAGIDTQDNGFYVVYRGFGANRLTCLIDEEFKPCSMHIASRDDILKIMKDIFERTFIGLKHGWGVSYLAIDTGGHRTKELYAAIFGIPRIFMVKGQDRQPTRYTYNKELDLYLVRTCEYLAETEETCDTRQFQLPMDVSNDYCNQFCNVRKVKEQNKKTGEEKIIWKKAGQNDFRYADIHTYICLDVPTDRGILRHEIEKEGFVCNPLVASAAKVDTSNIGVNPANSNSNDIYENFVDSREDWI